MQIEECKLKKKYHRGHAVEVVWILGGFEATEEKKDFLFEVPDIVLKLLL